MRQERNLLSTRVQDIDDPEIKLLLEELESVTDQPLPSMGTLHLSVVLDLVLFPHGPGKRIPLKKDEFTGIGPATMKLSRLLREYPKIYKLCDELARRRGSSAEANEGSALYVFLNAFVSSGKGGLPDRRRFIVRR